MIYGMRDGLLFLCHPARVKLCRRAMPSIAWWTLSPFRRQSRRIFQLFMRAKA